MSDGRCFNYQSSVASLQEKQLILLAGAILGALFGSKLLHLLEHFPAILDSGDLLLWIGGKSILGTLLGATLAVEISKKIIQWPHSTGDLWVVPLAVGMMIGRIGCQLAGPEDLTYGVPSSPPWGWNYGDGIQRHPTAIYEILWLAFTVILVRIRKITIRPGLSFALFILLYSTGRLVLEFFKPPFGLAIPGTLPVALYLNLTAIQWAAIVGMIWFSILSWIRWHEYRNQRITLPAG
jgi:prolipoprotein diacylglyceryltransferase